MWNAACFHIFWNLLSAVPVFSFDLVMSDGDIAAGSGCNLKRMVHNIYEAYVVKGIFVAAALQAYCSAILCYIWEGLCKVCMLHLLRGVLNGMSSKESNLEQSYILLDLAGHVTLRGRQLVLCIRADYIFAYIGLCTLHLPGVIPWCLSIASHIQI